MEKDNIVAEAKTALNVALLKHNVMHAVASDKKKTTFALGILVVAALASGLGLKFFGGFIIISWGMVLSMTIYKVLFAIIGIYVLSVISKSIFKGSAKHDEFFRVMAFGMIIMWLSIIPHMLISFVVAIWGLVLVFNILKIIHKLTTGGALGAMAVTVVAFILLSMILSPTLGALGIRGMYMGGMEFKGGSMMDFYKSDSFEMDFNTEDGEGSFKMEDGKMIIEGPDGEKMEITIPDFN